MCLSRAAPALTDLLAASSRCFARCAGAGPHIKAGKIKALGAAAGRRNRRCPTWRRWLSRLSDTTCPTTGYGLLAPAGPAAGVITN